MTTLILDDHILRITLTECETILGLASAIHGLSTAMLCAGLLVRSWNGLPNFGSLVCTGQSFRHIQCTVIILHLSFPQTRFAQNTHIHEREKGVSLLTCSAESSRISGDVVGEYDRAHAGLSRAALAHQQHLPS